MNEKQGTVDTCNNNYKNNSKSNATPIVPTFFEALCKCKKEKVEFSCEAEEITGKSSARIIFEHYIAITNESAHSGAHLCLYSKCQ